jgi:hypothetical protein
MELNRLEFAKGLENLTEVVRSQSKVERTDVEAVVGGTVCVSLCMVRTEGERGPTRRS